MGRAITGVISLDNTLCASDSFHALVPLQGRMIVHRPAQCWERSDKDPPAVLRLLHAGGHPPPGSHHLHQHLHLVLLA